MGKKKQWRRTDFGGMGEIPIQVCCPHCEGTNVKKNGRKANGKQNFLCRACHKQFQAEYAYRGANPKIKQLSLKMALYGSGIRDTGKVLDLCPSSVLRMLRDHAKKVKVADYQHVIRHVFLCNTKIIVIYPYRLSYLSVDIYTSKICEMRLNMPKLRALLGTLWIVRCAYEDVSAALRLDKFKCGYCG